MKLRLFVPLTKVDAVQRIVYGIATAEEVDKSGEIFDYQTSKPLFQKWSDDISKVTDGKSLGNVRAMHGKVAAGKLTQIEFNDDAKQIEVAAKIVDDNEWNKVQEGVYTGFSIGGAYAKVWKDETLGKNRFTANPSEISVVDNPCVASATFSMIKADGVQAEIAFKHHGVEAPDEAERTEAPSNDAVAKRATVLAKATGDEAAWPEFIEQASAELTVLTPEKLEAAGQAAAKAAAEVYAAVSEIPVILTNEEVALEATKMAKAAGHEAKWPDYIVPARDALTKAAADKKKAEAKDDKKDDDVKEGDADAKDDKKTDKAFTATPRNPAPGLEQVWKAQDGSTFTTRKEAEAHNAELNKAATAPDAAKALAAALGKADVALALKPGEGKVVAEKADFSDDERKELAAKGQAMKDGSYPIRNKDDLGNAISAFGRASNKAATKRWIIKRAKELGATDMLPDKWDYAKKDAYFGDLRKDLYTVGRLAELIQSLEWLQQSTEYERAQEGDDSKLPEQGKAAIVTLCAWLRAMVIEETEELLDDDEVVMFGGMLENMHATRGVQAISKFLKAEAPALGWLAKVGAKHSMKDQATLNKAHDATAELGADCSGGSDAEKLAKAGARHSKADLAKIQAAHDNLVDVGAECGEDGDEDDAAKKLAKDAVAGDTLNKEERALLTKLVADNEALTKVAQEAVTKVEALTKRVEEIASQPMPGGPVAVGLIGRVVDKTQDDEAAAANAVLDELRKTNPDAIATAMIKLSQRNGMTLQPGQR
jgi:hypothetical protein